MGPSEEWIKEQKKEYKLYTTEINGEVFYFRPVKRGEHLAIQKEAFPDGVPVDAERVQADDNARLENLIVKKCVLWPENIDPETLGAGVPPMIVSMVMRYSGFGMATEPEEV